MISKQQIYAEVDNALKYLGRCIAIQIALDSSLQKQFDSIEEAMESIDGNDYMNMLNAALENDELDGNTAEYPRVFDSKTVSILQKAIWETVPELRYVYDKKKRLWYIAGIVSNDESVYDELSKERERQNKNRQLYGHP